METSFPTPTCVALTLTGALRTAHVSRLLVLLREARSLGLTVIVDIERLKFADPEALAQIVSEDATKIRNVPGTSGNGCQRLELRLSLPTPMLSRILPRL